MNKAYYSKYSFHNRCDVASSLSCPLQSRNFVSLWLLPSVHYHNRCLPLPDRHYKVLVYENPVYINTDVLTNTTFEVNADLTITVDNAPTSFNLTSTFTSKYQLPHRLSLCLYSDQHYQSTNLRTARFPKISCACPSSDLSGHISRFQRHVDNFVFRSEYFHLSNGQLYEQVNGATLQFSASGNVGYACFIPSLIPASISTTFSLVEAGTLQ